jgi:hypothetical protein
MAVRLSALSAGRPLPPGRFLVVISVRRWVNPRAIVRLEGLGKLKKSNDVIRNGTRDLPACSIVPQPTALLRSHWVALCRHSFALIDIRVSNFVLNIQLPVFHRGGPGSNPSLVMWNFVMDESGAEAGFLRELRFPLPIYIRSASPQSSSLSPEAGTIGQEWPQCQ